jgi:hypothetical protein
MEENQVESPTTVAMLWKSYIEACLPNAEAGELAAFRGCFYSAVLGVYGLLDFIGNLQESGDESLASEMMESLEKELEEYMVELNATPALEARDH